MFHYHTSNLHDTDVDVLVDGNFPPHSARALEQADRISSTTRASWNTSRTSSRLRLVSDLDPEIWDLFGPRCPCFMDENGHHFPHHGCEILPEHSKTLSMMLGQTSHSCVWILLGSLRNSYRPKLGSWSCQHLSTTINSWCFFGGCPHSQ